MTYRAKAYAKINLFLQVNGKRPDGYHELDTIMQSVSIYDSLELSLTNDDSIDVFCDNAELCGVDNIIYRAVEMFFSLLGRRFGVRISLNKKIPVAAGLGGGSADASATLLMLNKAVDNKFTIEQLMPIAAKLGADVPFCLVGGTQRCRGIGEILSEVSAPKMYYVLLKELTKKSTGQMFSVLDAAEYTAKCDIEEFIGLLNSGNIQNISSGLFNSFEYCWETNDMFAPFRPFSPCGMFLSGSGPTVCALFSNESAAKQCADALISKGYNAYFAESRFKGVEIE